MKRSVPRRLSALAERHHRAEGCEGKFFDCAHCWGWAERKLTAQMAKKENKHG